MNQICKATGESFTLDEEDRELLLKLSPVFGSKRFNLPIPTLSPSARLRRRFAFANQIHVYLRPSSASGKNIFSHFSDQTPFPVYENDLWWGDYDGRLYGREYDPQISFFEQVRRLAQVAPVAAKNAVNVENSDYCNNVSAIKNCYFVFNTSGAEDCMYCENAWDSRDCIDCSQTKKSELCFDCTMCLRCFNLQSSQDCEDCSDSYFLYNCRGVKNCFGCVNLRRAEYCIFNQQVSKQEYQKFLLTFDPLSFSNRSEMQEKAAKLFRSLPRPHAFFRSAENVSGNYINQSRDVFRSVFISDADNCRYCFTLDEGVRNCMDYSAYGRNAELVYETSRAGINVSNLRFCVNCILNCSELLYCMFCGKCENCFGCVGLQGKSYCILNKQYSKKEYEQLVPEIIARMTKSGEWGEFFPVSMSPYAANHSMLQRYFPLSKTEAAKEGLSWNDRTLSAAAGTIDASELPDRLPTTDDTIIAKSSVSGQPYKISSAEIRLLRKVGAPLPRSTGDERMHLRMRKLGGVKMLRRTCELTGKELLTTISADQGGQLCDREFLESQLFS